MLAERGLKATFFVVGEQLRAHRALAERAVAEGHWIGNHTLTHPRPLGEADDARVRDRGHAGARSARSRTPTACSGRPATGGELEPGLLSPAAVDALVDGDYTCVLWNAVPGRLEGPGRLGEPRAGRVRRRATGRCSSCTTSQGAAADRLADFLDRAAGALPRRTSRRRACRSAAA